MIHHLLIMMRIEELKEYNKKILQVMNKEPKAIGRLGSE